MPNRVAASKASTPPRKAGSRRSACLTAYLTLKRTVMAFFVPVFSVATALRVRLCAGCRLIAPVL